MIFMANKPDTLAVGVLTRCLLHLHPLLALRQRDVQVGFLQQVPGVVKNAKCPSVLLLPRQFIPMLQRVKERIKAIKLRVQV